MRSLNANPDILVVTPTLGQRSEITRTISSVAALIHKDRLFHCIVGPIPHVNWIKDAFPHVHLLSDNGCQSIYEALNHSIISLASRFNYFAYINDDDYWLPGFSALIRILDSSNDISLVYGRTRIHGLNGNAIGTIAHYPLPCSFPSLLRFGIPIFTQQSVLCRTGDLIALNGFDVSLKLAADTDLWARWIKSCRNVAECRDLCASYCFQGHRLSDDRALARYDHLLLLSRHPSPSLLVDVLFLISFRLYNLPLYAIRLLSSIMVGYR